MELERAIAAHFEEWDAPVVELAIFGTGAPDAIASAIEGFVERTLGSGVADCIFYRTSVGAVAGLALSDGRRVVLKAHQPHVTKRRLEAVQHAMRDLSESGFPCPAPLAVPAELALGMATVEALVDRGEIRDGHEPAVRAELARRLAEMTRILAPTARQALRPSWFTGLHEDERWPRPHSPLFDFEATQSGAESIDALASEARRVPRAGALVVGHFDWRAEHARFEGDRLIVAYDWDSLHVDLEPVVVGAAAHAFGANWEGAHARAAPTIDEVRAFITEYEEARGRPFEGDERRTLAGSLVYSLAYTARCTHALGAQAEARALAFRELLEREGPNLLRSL